MLVANNITMQFGARPLFENVSVKFGEGNRYGLIGANGSGKTTFMKILAGVLEPSAGNVSLDAHERMAFLRQDQFAYEDVRVLDVVMMGHEAMWKVMQEKDAIYANPDILLLDQPTNNLDINTIRWLENVINDYHGNYEDYLASQGVE